MGLAIMARMRSWLFTPAMRPERFPKAAEAGADVAILDLEDSIAPGDKAEARRNALAALANPGPTLRALRINAVGSLVGLDDLRAFLASEAQPEYLVLPKAESAGVLRVVARLLDEAGKDARLVAQVEGVRGLAEAEAMATATPRLSALMFGAADMAADLGAAIAWEPLVHARSRLVAACVLGGVAAIDAPFFALKGQEGLVREANQAAALGFAGKCAVHPSQIGAIHDAMTPQSEQVAWARAILAENTKGTGVVGGLMVDEAIARSARRILAAAGEPVATDRPPRLSR